MPDDHGLKRLLGPIDATCVVVGAIIGVGIFFTPSRIATVVESPALVMVAWSLGGLIALLGALTFAEIGGQYPGTGAQYAALRDAFGSLVSFVFVFCNATAIQAGATGIIAFVCALHLSETLGITTSPAGATAISIALIGTLMVANILGVRWGSRIQNATVALKLLALLMVAGLAVTFSGDVAPAAAADAPEAARRSTLSLLFIALVPALFSYGGWQQALWVSGEVRDARRNVPFALIVGVVIVVSSYLLVNWAYLRLLGVAGVAQTETLASDAVAVIWGDAGRRVVAAAVAISAYGVLNAQLLAGPRLIHALAVDGRFFAPFRTVHARFRTPIYSIMLIAGAAMALLLAAGTEAIDRILTGIVFIDGVFFMLTGLALIVLRHRYPRSERPVRVPGYPIVPLAFVALEACVIIGAYLDGAVRSAALIGAGWIVAAVVLWSACFRKAGAT